MAIRKTNNKKTQSIKLAAVFWLVFIVVITSIFFINLETIKKNFNLFITRLSGAAETTTGESLNLDDPAEVTEELPSGEIVPQITPAVTEPDKTETAVTQPLPSVTAQPVTPAPRTPVQTETPITAPAPPVQMRDRPVYFTQVDNSGQILHTRVTRRIPVSQSPMQDALNILLTGPSSEELNRGIINLIPKNTRLLSATIHGSTAYISFSEDFIFNTFGVEGYIAQLRQIVWTVTEFSNVNDVQILIEGRRMDYLGEGIWIGSPISRQSF
ncbi:MAG: GerMN domain-containing protein [Treponema sp.]|nr:GerMN domain-containing protein [Treponema sp.]